MFNISIVDIIFFISASFVSLSYFFTDILLLRILAITGCTGYMIGSFVAGLTSEGMLVFFIFSVINFTVNSIQSVRIILDRREVNLPEELRDIYYRNFSKMRPNEFFKLYKMASLVTVHKNSLLIKQGRPVEHLILIQTGEAKVVQDDHEIATINTGFFAGEMSFLSESLANANIVVKSDDLQYLSWDKTKLESLKAKNRDLYEKFKQSLAVNVILKVAKHVKDD